MLDAAIKLDPHFAAAYAQKASTLADLTGSFASNACGFRSGYAEAATIARRAIALAPNLALGHGALSDALWGQLDFRAGLAEYGRALDLSPDDVDVLMGYSRLAAPIGQRRGAIAAAGKAADIDPLNPKAHALLANAYFAGRRYEDTLRVLKRVLELSPGREPALIMTGDALTLLGRYTEAGPAYAKADADDLFRLTGEAILAARTHNSSVSDDKLTRITEAFGEAASYQVAQVLAQREETEKLWWLLLEHSPCETLGWSHCPLIHSWTRFESNRASASSCDSLISLLFESQLSTQSLDSRSALGLATGLIPSSAPEQLQSNSFASCHRWDLRWTSIIRKPGWAMAGVPATLSRPVPITCQLNTSGKCSCGSKTLKNGTAPRRRPRLAYGPALQRLRIREPAIIPKQAGLGSAFDLKLTLAERQPPTQGRALALSSACH